MVDTKLPALLGDWSIMIVQVLLEYSWLPCYNTVNQLEFSKGGYVIWQGK